MNSWTQSDFREVFNRSSAILAACLGLLAAPATITAQIHDQSPLELSGFSVSQSHEVEDDQTLEVNQPFVRQLLYRILKTSPMTRAAASRFSADVELAEAMAKPGDFRFWVFDRPGMLQHVRVYAVAGASPKDEVNRVFVCECESESGVPFVVLCRSLPSAIEVGEPIAEPIRMHGFLHSRSVLGDNAGSFKPGTSVLLFVADRIGWYPTQPTSNQFASGGLTDLGNAKPIVTASHVELAQRGFDVGLLDSVRAADRRPLSGDDAEAFFQLLACSQNAIESSPSNLNQPTADVSISRVGFGEMMKRSRTMPGNAVRITGMVRNCEQLQIPDADLSQRLGLDYYYQLNVFPNLNGNTIDFVNAQGQRETFRSFPVTICCTQLPGSMTSDTIERQSVAIEGFYYRIWRYQSERSRQSETNKAMISPLVVAESIRIVPASSSILNQLLGWFVGLLLLAGATILLWFRWSDRKSKRPPAGKRILDQLPDEIDLSSLPGG